MSGGGGNSSSNPDTRYANLDRLYGIQSQASQFMLDNAMPNIPGLTANSASMVADAMDGTLARSLRETAGNNAQMSVGAALDANRRNTERYGMGFNTNRILSENNRNAIMGAATKVGEMNKAEIAAEDMKWNRNANFYGQVMGMNNGAMQGINSATSGMNTTNYTQTANDKANAQGYGQAGAAFANALFKADGGEVVAPRMATGGNAWEAYKAANPVSSVIGSSRGRKANAIQAIFAGAAPQLLGAGIKDILNLNGKGGNIVKTGKKAYDWIKGFQAGQSQPTNAGLSFETNPDVVAGNVDAGIDATGAAGAATDMAATAQAMADTYAAAEGAQSFISSAPAATDAVVTAVPVAEGVETVALLAANGGYIKNRKAQHFAAGGMPTLKKMSVSDDASVAQGDSNTAMQLVKMDDVRKPNNAIPVQNAGYNGRTDGNGETSSGDPNGFGKEHGDYRGVIGKGILSYVGNGIFPGLGTAASYALHPVLEQATRNAINIGDKIGGAGGAMMMDPVGTAASGKYTPEEIIKGSILGPAGKWLGLNKGGDVEGEPVIRENLVPGGEVEGPGNATSDSIPAWLSDGEHVQNETSVSMVGKGILNAINDEGLKVRDGKKSKRAAMKSIGSAMAERGLELKRKAD